MMRGTTTRQVLGTEPMRNSDSAPRPISEAWVGGQL
jgi:hypothetical protein